MMMKTKRRRRRRSTGAVSSTVTRLRMFTLVPACLQVSTCCPSV